MKKRTYCRICEAACGLLVDENEEGLPIGLRPDREHPVSRGFVCAKGTRFFEVARHPERLLSPMQRQSDGSLARIGWKEAMAEIGARVRPILERYGPHSVGIYFGNPLAFNSLGAVSLVGFAKSLGTRNIYSAGSQDCNNKFAAAQILHGSPVIQPIPDFAHTDLAVLFGTNPAISQSSFVHLEGGSRIFSELIAKGKEIVWVDPRRTESASRWGTHLALRPGSDVWLLLSLLSLLGRGVRSERGASGLGRLLELAERFPPARASLLTGIPEEEIVGLAEKIREAKRATFHMSVGVNQGPFGTLSYIALQALAYVTGNFDSRGGLLFHPLSVQMARLFRLLGIGTSVQKSRIGGFPSVLESLPAAILADEILTPGPEQIRAMFVIAGDPLLSVPGEARLREAFRSLDFLCSIDLFENQTAKEADLLLPTTSWLERWDVAATSAPFQQAPLLQTTGPVAQPPGEVRHEARILGDILGALGKRNLVWALGRLPLWRVLPSVGYGLPAPRPSPGRYLGRGPLTPGHVVRFWHEDLEPEAERVERLAVPPSSGAFTVIGRRRRLGHNSWLHGGTRDGNPEKLCWMGEGDLLALGIPEGGTVEIRSRAGAVQLKAIASPGLAPGTVVIPHGLADANLNALIPSGESAVERISGQHHMTGISAEVTVLR